MLSAPLLRSRHQSTHSSSLTSLRMENCSLKNSALEVLAHGVRHSNVKHISLRKNRINHMGAVALALLIRDYELPASGASILADTQHEVSKMCVCALHRHAVLLTMLFFPATATRATARSMLILRCRASCLAIVSPLAFRL